METSGSSKRTFNVRSVYNNAKKLSANYKSVDKSSNSETSRKELRRVENYHTDLLDVWSENGEVDPEQLKNEDLFKADINKQNFIHRVINDTSGGKMPFPPQAMDVIQQLVLRDPKLFTAEDRRGETPIIEAAKHQMPVLSLVIGLLLPTPLHDNPTLYISCKGGQGMCPLRQVSEALLEECQKKRDAAMNGSILKKMRQTASNICLHEAIDIGKLVDYDKSLRHTLKEALNSPIRALACLDAILHDGNFDEDFQGDYKEWVKTFKTLLELCPDSVFGYAPYEKFTPLQTALRLYSKPQIHHDMLFDFVHLLIDRAPWSIFIESGPSSDPRASPKTAYHMLREIDSENASSEVQPKARAEELLKRTCIGYEGMMWDTKTMSFTNTITSEEKIRYLYSDIKLENQFCFNLVGESEVINKLYIETIKKNSGLKFETTLEFVKLPYWKSHQPPVPGDQPLNGGYYGQSLESDPYIYLFEWLWSSGTRKIFRVDVDDVGPEPHTNAGIRQALRGSSSEKAATRDFEIETWEWKKIDICTETISVAAPTARHVHLWSSGNTAILRGWGSGSGLAKLQNLERLTITICPTNRNDANDCLDYLDEFKQNLKRHCNNLEIDNINIEVYQDSHALQGGPDRGSAGDGLDGANQMNEETPNSEDWLAKLTDFQEFIGEVNQAAKQSVKVAILDDGFRLNQSHSRKYKAQSFCHDKEAYFAGPCEHGTEMATCVWEVCPWAELFIGRLDDTHAVEDQNFTIQSCCKALRWALAMEVDVISMSWTFPAKKEDDIDDYKAEFDRLIKEALEKNILLFGSLPDRGPTVQTTDLVPIGLPGVIRIGSATVHGTGAPENIYGGADFLLPGQGKTDGGKVVSGSSYATAFASGLAATVLLAIKVHADLTDDVKVYKCLEQASTSEGMKKVFKRLSQQKPDAESARGFYVRPYHTFRSDFGGSLAEKRAVLGDIVHKMVLRDLEHK
ncbi:peptidase S8/S53 domain-containing protein [Trichoderma chlorosporum]